MNIIYHNMATIKEMKNDIIKYLGRNKFNTNLEKLDDSNIKNIYELYFNKLKANDNVCEYTKYLTPTEKLYFGLYYKFSKNYDKMFEYFIKGMDECEMGSFEHEIGFYYYEQFNTKNMKKYYKLAIKKGFLNSMYEMHMYYYRSHNFICCDGCTKCQKMIKYLMMAYEDKYYDSSYNYDTNNTQIQRCLKIINLATLIIKYNEENHDILLKSCDDVFYSIGKNYEKENNNDKMIQYYKVASERKHIRSIKKLIKYYKNISDDDNVIKYYSLKCDIRKDDISYKLGKYYCKKGMIDNMIEHYLISIEKECVKAIKKLSEYYRDIQDEENMIKYYTILNKHNNKAFYYVGEYYAKKNDEKMIEYYNLAIDNKCDKIKIYNALIVYYEKKGDEENIMKYLVTGKDFSSELSDKLNNYINDNVHLMIKYYDILDKYQLHSLNKMLSSYMQVRDTINNSYNSYNLDNFIKIGWCCICMEDKEVLTFKCKHFVCAKCYKINACPLCREKIF